MKKIILLFTVMLCVFACDDKDPVENMIQLKKGQPTDFIFDGNENSATISFIAGSTWFIQKDTIESKWYSISPIQGQKGDLEITINTEKNESKAKRETYFTLFCGNESQNSL